MISLDFIKAGNAIFTVDNGQGQHYTFKVSQKENTPHFVSLLTSPDNYTYIGIAATDWKLRLTRASKITQDAISVRVFNFALRVVSGQQPLPQGYRIQHEGKCGKCGRPLTDPISIETGLGPICRGK